MKSVAISNTDDRRPADGARQPAGDGRLPERDGTLPAGTSGAPAGLSGDERRASAVAWTCAMGVAGLVIGLNIIARLQEAPREVVAPFVDELTSLAALAFAFLVPGVVTLWSRRRRPSLAAVIALQSVGFAAFAAMHLAGSMSLRSLLYPSLLRQVYRWDAAWAELPFELGKDVIGYAFSAAGFALVLRWRLAAVAPVQVLRAADATFDIQDGARLVRAPLVEILAARSAGNYVEFLLRDGRRPLMRTSLSALQTALESAGFVRTHRSWLVNADRVTGLRPEGSGDYAVELGEIEAPLSRRFPAALAMLRA